MTRLYPRLAALALAASLAVTGATLASTGAPAYGADLVVSGAPTARIAYDDLNLRSEAGVRRLETRVRAAAERVCDVDAPATSTLRDRLDSRACRDAAIAAAAPQVRRAVAGFGTGAPVAIALTLGR
jgi:UrcA family protein